MKPQIISRNPGVLIDGKPSLFQFYWGMDRYQIYLVSVLILVPLKLVLGSQYPEFLNTKDFKWKSQDFNSYLMHKNVFPNKIIFL